MDDKGFVISALASIRSSMRWTNWRMNCKTGKLNADGTLSQNVAEGLSSPYIWVRFGDDRTAAAVRSLRIRNAAGIDVVVAFDSLIGEDVVLEIDPVRAAETLGAAAAAFNTPEVPESVPTAISALDLRPGSVMVAADISMNVRIMPTWIPGGGWWDGTALIPLAPTATTDRKTLVVIGVDPLTMEAVVALTADRYVSAELIAIGKPTTAGAVDILAVTEADPTIFWVGALELANGATSINPAKIVDRRLFDGPVFTGATGASDGTRGLVPKPLAGDDTKFLCGDGTWNTPAGGGSLPSPLQSVNTTSENITSSTYGAASNSAEGTFTAPSSGSVYVTVSGRINIGNTQHFGYLSWQLREGSSIGSGAIVVDADDTRALRAGNTVTTSAPFFAQASHRYLVEGLTAGATYNIRVYRRASTTVSNEFRAILVEPVP